MQYDRELDAGNIDANALYLTPDEAIDLSQYATKEEVGAKANVSHTHSVEDVNGALPKILTDDIYGTNLPSAGTIGRIFFKKVGS